ncbi:short-chain dehydrogenase reductase sdr : Oxidoreductase, short-chain dehydrogenase/reductase family protein OS=uncultured planctomycete GN=HGMM_F13D05C11 PE=3 SV=1: adh_short [Gemmata massiliana]|uniref:Ketoreductase domain-containing protein n=1 Tax=Gemmata massiliana TaxID=1210884 RepID=A0A6P2DJ66_9BACT|nr:SDR family NAD(P)-dependent oxidoreductase [Gemmata massiliana]VTS02199.1 short-chain dehydrogenase reductase sdr : Oxidoreductase, short-chain dehydrogenase/reductase family protein OS=uncultured planctomycete GN=HGMM_F13D05C11 PE=3 SV=1: adh_short [Gemmata massiliana]
MRRDVRGRVVLVTGASRGIGRRVAERLAKLGAILALTARSVDDLTTLADALKATGARVEVFAGDLTKSEDRTRIVSQTVECFGRLDVLMNCAGVCSFGEFSSSSEEVVRKVLEVNFFAPVEMIRVAAPHLTRSFETARDGWRPAIVNLASICGRWGIPSMSEHCASKHAFVGLTESLRGEFERFGIDVLLVLPGLVRSDDLQKHLLRNEGKIHLNFEGAQPSDEVADSVVRSLLNNRVERAVGFASWWVWFGKRMFPRGVRFFMQRKVWKYARREKRAGVV